VDVKKERAGRRKRQPRRSWGRFDFLPGRSRASRINVESDRRRTRPRDFRDLACVKRKDSFHALGISCARDASFFKFLPPPLLTRATATKQREREREGGFETQEGGRNGYEGENVTLPLLY